MRAVIQLTEKCSVSCGGKTVSECGRGMLVLLGIHRDDTEKEALLLIDKILKLRIFHDENGKLNLSSLQVGADILVVSNFTLWADATKSRRPDFLRAKKYDEAEKMYSFFLEKMKEAANSLSPVPDGTPKIFPGVFGGDMKVSLINDGPITVILDTEEF